MGSMSECLGKLKMASTKDGKMLLKQGDVLANQFIAIDGLRSVRTKEKHDIIRQVREHYGSLSVATETESFALTPVNQTVDSSKMENETSEVAGQDPMFLRFDETLASDKADDLVIESEDIPDYMASVFERLLQKLGYKSKVVIISSDKMNGTPFGLRVQEDILRINAQAKPNEVAGGKYWVKAETADGRKYNVALINSDILSGTKEDMIAGILAHEIIGHGIFFELFNSAPVAIRDKIEADFESLYRAVQETKTIPEEFFEYLVGNFPGESRESLTESLLGLNKDQLRLEWMAHQITKSVLRTRPAQSLMERFWDRVAVKIKELYYSFKEDPASIFSLTPKGSLASVDEFVRFLYSQQVGVENFNIKLSGRYGSLLKFITGAMFSNDETGKMVINPSFLVERTDKKGKTVQAFEKLLFRYKSKESPTGFVTETVRTAHAQSALFTVHKNQDGSWSISTREMVPMFDDFGQPVMFGDGQKKQGKITSTLMTIGPELMPKVKGMSPSNVAYAVAQNVRDMLIIAEAATTSFKHDPNTTVTSIKSLKTKTVITKETEEAIKAAQQTAMLISQETGVSPNQEFINLLSGIYSPFYELQKTGMRGTDALSDRNSERLAAVLTRHADKFERIPSKIREDLVAELAQSQTVPVSESERLLEETLAEEMERKAYEAEPTEEEIVAAQAEVDIAEQAALALQTGNLTPDVIEYLKKVGIFKTVETEMQGYDLDLAVGGFEFPNVELSEENTENQTHFNRSISVGDQKVGEVEVVKKAKTWRISNVKIEESERGKRIAQATYLKLARLALQENKILKSDMKNGYMTADAVRAWRALAKKGMAFEHRNNFRVELPNFGITDQLAEAAFEKMYENELAIDTSKLKKKKSAKKRESPDPYAEILKETPKVSKRKKKVRKQLDMAKIQAKRDKANQFVLAMKNLEDQAKRARLSLAQFMVTTGQFTAEEIRKNIARYHSSVSRFSQSETIRRLAHELGLIDENGQAGLELLIQSMFPAQEINGVKYPGASGKIEHLEASAKEVLIYRLQAAIVNKTGLAYNIEEEQTVGQRKDELVKAEQEESIFKKVFGLIKWVESNWEARLSTTKSGKELVYRLKRYMWKTIDYQRDWLLQLNEIGRKYESPEQRDHLYRLLTGDATIQNEMELKFVELIQTINHNYAREMELLGVRTYYKNGSSELFIYDPATTSGYFPHMWEPGAFQKPSDVMIQSLIDSGEATTREQAIKLIKVYSNSYIKANKFANMEMARETEMGGWITDPIKVYHRYVTQSSKRLAQLKEFGATPEVALAQFALKHFKEGKSSEALDDARDIINQSLGVRVEESIMKDPKFGMTYGMLFSTGLLLQHAAFVQPGTAMNMAMVGGISNLVKGISKVVPAIWGNKSAKAKVEWAKMAGVLAFTMNKELYDIVLDEKTRAKGDKILRSFGVTQIDSAMRIVGAMVGKMYAIEEAMKYAAKPTPKGEARLKRIGLNPASIVNRADPGILEPQEIRQAALAFTEETNFVTNPLSVPVMLKNHPLGRIFFLFSRFVFQQHHLWKTIIADNKGKALKGILAGITIGTPMMLLKMLVQGDDPEEVLKKDGLAKMIWKAFTTGGGPGIFAEALGNAVFQSVGKQTGAGTAGMALDSPALGLADTMGKGIKSASKIAFADSHTDSDVNKAMKASMMAFQAVAIGVLPDKIGVPLNAAAGFSRPLVERKFYPNKTQKKTTYLR